jgi:hypothetical protein
MLSETIETKHLVSFKQALYYLEIFDKEGIEWKIDQDNVLRRKDETGTFNSVTSWGELGCIDDWYLERVELKSGNRSPSLSTLKSVYSKRRRTLASPYSISHRIRNRIISRPGGPRLPKRRKLFSVNPWTGFIKSHLENRRRSRTPESPRYNPTVLDLVNILLAAAPFVHTRKRQIEEACCAGPIIHRIV